MRKISILAVLLIAASAAITACSGTKPQSANPLPSQSSAMPSASADPTLLPSPSPAPSASQPPAASNSAPAEALFKDNCMSCHGANLQGAFGPNLQHVGARKTKDQIVGQIQNGGGDMPGFDGRLTKDQVEVLAAWLSAKK